MLSCVRALSCCVVLSYHNLRAPEEENGDDGALMHDYRSSLFSLFLSSFILFYFMLSFDLFSINKLVYSL